MTDKPKSSNGLPNEAPAGQAPEEMPDALESAEREAARRWLLQRSNRDRNERLANGRADRRRDISCG
jgi:hypothetical protein